jgi:hypothetical protein
LSPQRKSVNTAGLTHYPQRAIRSERYVVGPTNPNRFNYALNFPREIENNNLARVDCEEVRSVGGQRPGTVALKLSSRLAREVGRKSERTIDLPVLGPFACKRLEQEFLGVGDVDIATWRNCDLTVCVYPFQSGRVRGTRRDELDCVRQSVELIWVPPFASAKYKYVILGPQDQLAKTRTRGPAKLPQEAATRSGIDHDVEAKRDEQLASVIYRESLDEPAIEVITRNALGTEDLKHGSAWVEYLNSAGPVGDVRATRATHSNPTRPNELARLIDVAAFAERERDLGMEYCAPRGDSFSYCTGAV